MPDRTDASAATEVVADEVLALLRTVRKAKARMAADAGGDVESATRLLLYTVAAAGPVRTSALAVSVHSDLSTVSRQVAALVTGGLLERRADPADGRACLLALTPAGEAAVAEHLTGRAAFFAAVLHDWTADEMRQFSDLLARFTGSYDRVHADRIADRIARRAAQPEATEGPQS